jgi:Domain of unknown function (DUF5615)
VVGSIKFYLDEHVPNAVLRGLRVRGVDVLSVAEAGMLGASDEDHLARAASEGRVMFSQDEDFLRLGATVPGHAGIVFAYQQKSIGSVVQGLMLIHGVLEPAEMIGRVEYL